MVGIVTCGCGGGEAKQVTLVQQLSFSFSQTYHFPYANPAYATENNHINRTLIIPTFHSAELAPPRTYTQFP